MKSIGVYVAFEEDKLLNDQLYPLYHDWIIFWKFSYFFCVVKWYLSFEENGIINAKAMLATANKA